MAFVDNDQRWRAALDQIIAICEDNQRADRKDLALEFIIRVANKALDVPTIAHTLGRLARSQ